MKDRVPKYPGRVKITRANGTTEYVTIERADEPVSGNEGTPLNKSNLLDDDTSSLLGLGENATPNDALAALYNLLIGNGPQSRSVSLSTSGWTYDNVAEAFTQTVSISGVTANNRVIVSPAPESAYTYAKAGAYCSTQLSGKLKFVSDTRIDVNVNVIIL